MSYTWGASNGDADTSVSNVEQMKPSRVAGYPIPRCPYCKAAYFSCKTDGRGICIKKPRTDDTPTRNTN